MKIHLQELPTARGWDNLLGHLENLGDEAGREEVGVAGGGTGEGAVGFVMSREGHKRGKGNHR